MCFEGFTIICKALKKFFNKAKRRRIKKYVDMELANVQKFSEEMT